MVLLSIQDKFNTEILNELYTCKGGIDAKGFSCKNICSLLNLFAVNNTHFTVHVCVKERERCNLETVLFLRM